MDSVPLPQHRAAIVFFLSADWFFGKFAHNYVARNLLPKTQKHMSLVQDTGIMYETLCLPCWQHRRCIALDDEFHLVCVCLEFQRARTELLNSASATTHLDTRHDVLQLLSGESGSDLQAFAQFLARPRQTRRQLKLTGERYSRALETKTSQLSGRLGDSNASPVAATQFCSKVCPKGAANV